jgi:hypothetical protein
MKISGFSFLLQFFKKLCTSLRKYNFNQFILLLSSIVESTVNQPLDVTTPDLLFWLISPITKTIVVIFLTKCKDTTNDDHVYKLHSYIYRTEIVVS